MGVDSKAIPQSILDKEARKQALKEAEEDPTRAGWYPYFKDRDVRLLSNECVIHPTVLLAIADHYARAAAGTSRRVVGCLLGEKHSDRTIHVTNTFAIPFEELPTDRSVWYLDNSYLDKMYKMFRKINAKERVVGWYSTASAIQTNDINIHQVFTPYNNNPLFLIVDVHATDTTKLPIQTYFALDQPSPDELFRKTFVHTSFSIGATEAEEVGVEHLLRDVQAQGVSTLSTLIADRQNGMLQASEELNNIAHYLHDILEGKLPPQPHILALLQNLLNALPDKSDPAGLEEAFRAHSNDAFLSAYVAVATRLVMVIHALVKNKLKLREIGRENSA